MDKINKEIPSPWEEASKIDINLINIGKEFGINVVGDLKNKLNEEVYTWYVSSDRYILKLMCNRGKFREDIFEICPFCKAKKNNREHVVNECQETENIRKEIIDKINSSWKVPEGVGMMGLIQNLYFYWYDGLGQDKKIIIIKEIKEFCRKLYEKYRDIKIS